MIRPESVPRLQLEIFLRRLSFVNNLMLIIKKEPVLILTNIK